MPLNIEPFIEYPDRIKEPRSHCSACKAAIETDEYGFTDKQFCRIQRGSIELPDVDGLWTSDEPESNNIKFEIHLCSKCFFTDPDLCRFFNRIGYNTR